jgi:hypothetical protein
MGKSPQIANGKVEIIGLYDGSLSLKFCKNSSGIGRDKGVFFIFKDRSEPINKEYGMGLQAYVLLSQFA